MPPDVVLLSPPPPPGGSSSVPRCQCFFTAEKFKPGRGVQLDAFDAKFRCPATVGCILEAPEGPEDLSSDRLSDGWKNDGACPFASCEFDSAGSDRAIVSCKRSSFRAILWDFTIGDYVGIGACELHPGAEFCVRSSEATSDGSAAANLGNQVTSDLLSSLPRGTLATPRIAWVPSRASGGLP